MDTAKQELVQIWLAKAQQDLAVAHKLSSGPDPYLGAAIFHCQQAAEKAVKDFLVFQERDFEKTHNIRLLIELAIPYEASFSTWLAAGEYLTPFAAKFRYPGETMQPEPEEFQQALADAEGLYTFVLSVLPTEVHPPSR
jgi:HEPN domain-containing protein